MDLRSLRYFVETVRQGGFTRAAASLGVTQSTVSKMLRQLEDEVGEPLIVRGSRQIVLTDCGRVVLARGQEILAAAQRLMAEVRETQALRRGRLDLGIPPMINTLFTPVLQAFRARYPDIVLNLHEAAGPEIEQRVARGELEIGLSVLPLQPGLDVVATPVVDQPVWALGVPGAFRTQRDTVRLQALRQAPLVLLNDDFALTRMLRHAFHAAGFAPQIVAQSGQWDWVASMASAGMGVALLPESFIARLRHDDLLAARVVDPDLRWQVAHLWNGRYLSQAARAWLEMCEDALGGKWLPDDPDGNTYSHM